MAEFEPNDLSKASGMLQLESDPRKLPDRIGPDEQLKDTRRGHEKLLNRRLRELRNLENEDA